MSRPHGLSQEPPYQEDDGATEEQWRFETEAWRKDPVAQKEYQDWLDSQKETK